MTLKLPLLAISSLYLGVFLSSCSSDDPIQVEVPATYSFSREGASTVNYTGQNQRLDMADEMISYIRTGIESPLEQQKLLNMFHNENNPFANSSLNQSGDDRKQIAGKLFGQGDGSTPVDGGATVLYFENLLKEVARISSSNGQTAENGKAGVISSGSSKYLVNENGFEPAQLIAKGLMGALMFHQGTNVYLGAEKLAASATAFEDGSNFTELEHHFDESYGYFNLPTDMTHFEEMGANRELRYWAEYAHERNGASAIGYDIAAKIHEAYRSARACASAQYDHDGEEIDCSYEEAVITIKTEWELIMAASVIHYFNSAKTQLTDQARLCHSLSEGMGFLRSLKYVNGGNGRVSPDEIESIERTIGSNLWEIVPANLDAAINKMVEQYPELSDVKDQL